MFELLDEVEHVDGVCIGIVSKTNNNMCVVTDENGLSNNYNKNMLKKTTLSEKERNAILSLPALKKTKEIVKIQSSR